MVIYIIIFIDKILKYGWFELSFVNKEEKISTFLEVMN